jgi:hypothetical protein
MDKDNLHEYGLQAVFPTSAKSCVKSKHVFGLVTSTLPLSGKTWEHSALLNGLTLLNTKKHKKLMYILKAILNQAGSVWKVESIAMQKRDAERLLRSRLANNKGAYRYAIFKA